MILKGANKFCLDYLSDFRYVKVFDSRIQQQRLIAMFQSMILIQGGS